MPEDTRPPADEATQSDAIKKNVERVLAYKRELIALAVILAVVGIIYGYISGEQERIETEAREKVYLAMSEPGLEPEERQKRLETVVEQYPTASAAAEARLRLMQSYFQDGEMVKARETAESFLSDLPKHFFAPQVRVELGRLREWEGNWAAARAEYEKAFASGRAYIIPDAKMGVARCLEMEQELDRAREQYQDVVAMAENKPWLKRLGETARFRLVALREGTESITVDPEEETTEGVTKPSTNLQFPMLPEGERGLAEAGPAQPSMDDIMKMLKDAKAKRDAEKAAEGETPAIDGAPEAGETPDVIEEAPDAPAGEDAPEAPEATPDGGDEENTGVDEEMAPPELDK